MLVTTHALLNNPPGPKACPVVAEQWRIDFNQLIITAINTPSHRWQPVHHSGGALAPSHAQSCTPMVAMARMLRVDRGLAASLAMADLRAELDRRGTGEYGRITIERH
jgi:hypothetical protein